MMRVRFLTVGKRSFFPDRKARYTRKEGWNELCHTGIESGISI
jgi:hypothetical protein